MKILKCVYRPKVLEKQMLCHDFRGLLQFSEATG